MTTIPPTPAPSLPAALAAAAGPVVTIAPAPPELAKLPPGATIDAVVLAARAAAAADEARPAVTLRTPAGEVSVRTSLPLDDGARVALEVLRSTGQQVTARVVSIDDVPVKQALAQAAREAPAPEAAPEKSPPPPAPRGPVLPPGQAWTPSGPIPLTALQPLSATVLTAPAPIMVPPSPLPAGTPATALAAFLPGSELGIRIVSVQTPQTPGAPAGPAAASPAMPGAAPVAPAAPAPANPMTPGASPAPTSGAVPTPPAGAPPAPGAGQPAAARPGGPIPSGPLPASPTPTGPAVLAPGAPATAPGASPAAPLPITATETQGLKLPAAQGLGPAPPQPPQTVQPAPAVTRLTGQVTGTAANGATMVQTPAGELQLNVRANLPPGTSIVLDVLTALTPRADAPLPAPPAPAPPGLPLATPAAGWPALSEALTLLQRVDPPAAALLAQAVPDGGPRTTLAALAFMQAMRSGDARQWPGDTALRGLERAGPRGAQLAAQLSAEVRELAGRAAETQSEWRTTPMPWNAEGRIERVNLITRREGESEEDGAAQKKGGKGKGTRFLVNLELSRLGAMQLDGFFATAERQFDLMIRTAAPLPEDMRRDLVGLFAASNAALGLKGGLSFQVVRTFPDPRAAPPAPDRGGVWV